MTVEHLFEDCGTFSWKTKAFHSIAELKLLCVLSEGMLLSQEESQTDLWSLTVSLFLLSQHMQDIRAKWGRSRWPMAASLFATHLTTFLSSAFPIRWEPDGSFGGLLPSSSPFWPHHEPMGLGNWCQKIFHTVQVSSYHPLLFFFMVHSYWTR